MAEKKIIFTNSFVNLTENYLDWLCYIYGIDYCTYMIIINNKIFMEYVSNKIWQKSYVDNKLYLDCPLIKMSARHEHEENFYMEWNTIGASNKKEAEIIEARKDFKINRGVTFRFTHEFKGIKYHEVLAFSASKADKYHEERIRMKQYEIIKSLDPIRRKGTAEANIYLYTMLKNKIITPENPTIIV